MGEDFSYDAFYYIIRRQSGRKGGAALRRGRVPAPLPRGTFIFHFGVDLIMDGTPGLDQSYFDNVIVDII